MEPKGVRRERRFARENHRIDSTFQCISSAVISSSSGFIALSLPPTVSSFCAVISVT